MLITIIVILLVLGAIMPGIVFFESLNYHEPRWKAVLPTVLWPFSMIWLIIVMLIGLRWSKF